MEIRGKTILITGGTSGIGLAFAREFFKENCKVIICGRREDRLEEIKKQFPGIVTRVVDVMIEEDRISLANWVLEQYPEISVLINNAGIQLLADLTKPVDLSRIKLEIETNLVAPLHLASLMTPHFAELDDAAIINVSSGLAFVPIAFMPVYCATKAAVHSYTLSLRYQLKNTKVKVFEIIPPSVDTELGSDRRDDKSQSHGGMPVDTFIEEAMLAIKEDVLEAAIGMSAGLREKRETLLEQMNNRFH